ncbi:hypothetical protein SAY86_010909 [Trapa natans]|uniref:Uncharacterized protein n=1 Tax=Trapa natans TaxID=22666 RepID=A0AAN7LJ84_TRANT|nr:hypothetical protein SAY86_010909 [Trapa natans]
MEAARGLYDCEGPGVTGSTGLGGLIVGGDASTGADGGGGDSTSGGGGDWRSCGGGGLEMEIGGLGLEVDGFGPAGRLGAGGGLAGMVGDEGLKSGGLRLVLGGLVSGLGKTMGEEEGSGGEGQSEPEKHPWEWDLWELVREWRRGPRTKTRPRTTSTVTMKMKIFVALPT